MGNLHLSSYNTHIPFGNDKNHCYIQLNVDFFGLYFSAVVILFCTKCAIHRQNVLLWSTNDNDLCRLKVWFGPRMLNTYRSCSLYGWARTKSPLLMIHYHIEITIGTKIKELPVSSIKNPLFWTDITLVLKAVMPDCLDVGESRIWVILPIIDKHLYLTSIKGFQSNIL